MATTTPRKTVARRRPAPEPVGCHLCATAHDGETGLVIHLVEDHGAIWTVTNSFGLDDLVIPAPREASYDDAPTDDPGWVRRLIRRTA
ncbi:MAG: hypothetical protein JWO22_4226 [Frankiales bacterium]|nr:hypothetical protein [Frankiales bacterium]